MTLGERIYAMRAERNLSQIDLAEALDVSRQSVSKWETDASVPEMEKLIRMCGLFGVSMDELVRGNRADQGEAPSRGTDEVRVSAPQKRSTASIVVGIILLCLAGLTFFPVLSMIVSGVGTFGVSAWGGMVAAGIVCLAAKRRIALWSLWCAALVFGLVQKVYIIFLLIPMTHIAPGFLVSNSGSLGVSILLTILTVVLTKQKK